MYQQPTMMLRSEADYGNDRAAWEAHNSGRSAAFGSEVMAGRLPGSWTSDRWPHNNYPQTHNNYPRTPPRPTGSSPSPGPSSSSSQLNSVGISRIGADLLLLLLKARVPSMEVLTAKTDRELAILATKYDISLPIHLAHLPTLPPPRSAEEKEALSRIAAETDAPMDAVALKERPPRKARVKVSPVAEDVHAAGSTVLAPPIPIPPPAALATAATAPSPSTLSLEDLALEGAPVKERAPSTRRPRQSGDALTEQATKERAPSTRRPRQSGDSVTDKPSKERAPSTRRRGKTKGGGNQ